jgi:hypothetical protein
MNYGVGQGEAIRIASHLLDNLLAKEEKPAKDEGYYNGIFTLASVKDEWADYKQLAVQDVMLRPLRKLVVKKLVRWLKDPAVRESFVPAFPQNEGALHEYFIQPAREYFSIEHNGEAVGIVGG